MVKGFLGIDCGTQGLTCLFTDENLKTIAVGEGSYEMVPNLPEGHYEQCCEDWDAALETAMKEVNSKVKDIEVLAIGISGQMHGEVLLGTNDEPLSAVRLWCDDRNEKEGHELTELFNCKIPKRATVARFLWTIRNKPELAKQVKRITTPAGWIHLRLTGEHVLGIGDAAGMFPIDSETHDYDEKLISVFDQLTGIKLKSLLPQVRRVGEDADSVQAPGSKLLGLPEGIPVAAGEGDQVAALAGSLIGRSGLASISFGTSVCANIVGEKSFKGVSPAVDHFCAADGKPINMIWLRNGTPFFNTIVSSYGGFDQVMPQLLQAPPDCGGLLALPFMDDEPGLSISRGGGAMLFGLSTTNATPGNAAKAALLSTMFNLRLNCEILRAQEFPMTELVLTGGLAKTPECAQILADVFNLPVTILASADEGCSWGAAVMAKFLISTVDDWSTFLTTLGSDENIAFRPSAENAQIYDNVFGSYCRLLDVYKTNLMSL